MGRRRRINSERSIRRRHIEGRGQGSFDTYKPAIYTYEIPSLGKVARVKGLTTNRVHHLLSQLEKNFFILLDYDPEVSDIREQVSLRLEDTLMIAARRNIEHPYANHCPAEMTTDFYYCKNGVWHAAAIKESAALRNERVQEKLKIEELYWTDRNVPWSIQTEKNISRDKVKNLLWLHTGESIQNILPNASFLNDLTEAFCSVYQDLRIPFSDIINNIESYCKLPQGTVLQLFKHLVLTGRIPLELSEPINLSDPRIRYDSVLF